MTPYFSDEWLTIYQGDARDVLPSLPGDSVDCIVTSPPYWGLRDYGNDGQLGLEATPEQYVANLVAVFRELRRVLKPTGTCFLNLGDTYAANWSSRRPEGGGGLKEDKGRERITRPPDGLKSKDLVGIPWRVAFALQADGWYLRSDIIWSKPNPMPESVTDRPTKAHEYLFLLTKSARYFYDADAVREAYSPATESFTRMKEKWSPERTEETVRSHAGQILGNPTPHSGLYYNGGATLNPAGRNLRSVWTIATRPYPGAHFAVFPPELPERCIKAGSSERGVCPECGAPWERVSVPTDEYAKQYTRPKIHSHDQAAFGSYVAERREALGLSRADVSEKVVGTRSGACWNWEHHQPPVWGLYLRLKDALDMDDRFDEFLVRFDQNSNFRLRTERLNEPGPAEMSAVTKRLGNARRMTIDWQPTCSHLPTPVAHDDRTWDESTPRKPIPAVILDPFAGSGTTGMVANRLSRRAILIDLNADYLRQQMARNAQTPLGLGA